MSHGPVPGTDRILLVGFMAAGKTTVGRLLAERLGWTFTDLDDLVRSRTGRTAAQIIRESGEAAFRRIEAGLMAELLDRDAVVLAPGGGWAAPPAVPGATPTPLASLPPGTRTVWLRLSAAEAVRRAGADGTDRPLLGPSDGRLARAEALLAQRRGAYAAAEVVVDVEGKEPAAVATEILRRLGLEAGGR